MDDIQWWVWVIIAVVALALIGALLAASPGKRADRQRAKAAELRDHARDVEDEARQREADAANTRAEAEQARAQTDELEREAREKQESATKAAEEMRERLAEADTIDPDVDENSYDTREPTTDDLGGRDRPRGDLPREGPTHLG